MAAGWLAAASNVQTEGKQYMVAGQESTAPKTSHVQTEVSTTWWPMNDYSQSQDGGNSLRWSRGSQKLVTSMRPQEMTKR